MPKRATEELRIPGKKSTKSSDIYGIPCHLRTKEMREAVRSLGRGHPRLPPSAKGGSECRSATPPPRRNLPAIRRAGHLCSKSKGKKPVVWACAPGKTTWAVLHTVRRHGGRVEGIAIVEVDVPRNWLRRNCKRLWCSPIDIPPERPRRIIGFIEVTGPPTESKTEPKRPAG